MGEISNLLGTGIDKFRIEIQHKCLIKFGANAIFITSDMDTIIISHFVTNNNQGSFIFKPSWW